MMSLKQLILEVEREFPNYRNTDLRRAYNGAILHGGNKFNDIRKVLSTLHYMVVVPENVEFYQVKTSTRESHFFSQSPDYWQELRAHATTHKAVTRRPLNMLKLHYKTVSFEEYDEHDKNLATHLMVMAKVLYPQKSNKRTCLIQCIKYLILGNQSHTDACKSENPDYVLQKFLCNIGFDGWIRLYNVQTLKQDFSETEYNTIDEIMVCDLDNMHFEEEE